MPRFRAVISPILIRRSYYEGAKISAYDYRKLIISTPGQLFPGPDALGGLVKGRAQDRIACIR